MYRRKTVEALLRAHERERAAWTTERMQLLDRIMYLSGRPWEPAPYDQVPEPEPVPHEFIYPEEIPLD